MTDITDKIRAIAFAGLEEPLKKFGFHRHSRDFSRQFGESLQVINIEPSKWNTKDSGKFTINVGVHFSRVATLLYGKDPMPPNPKESRCLIRTRIGKLMPGQPDRWWSVTPNTNVENTAQELTAACVDYVLPWLEQFTTISGMNWTVARGHLQHTWTEAAANFVQGDMLKATQCVEAEFRRIDSDPSPTWKEERLAKLRKCATDQGIVIADKAPSSPAIREGPPKILKLEG